MECEYILSEAIYAQGSNLIIETLYKGSLDLPWFVDFDKTNMVYSITPTLTEITGIYPIQILLSDSFASSISYTFKI